MEILTQRRALQATVFVASFVPLGAGLAGVLEGFSMFADSASESASTDNHFRYLSGLLLAIGFSFMSIIPRIEKHSQTIKVLTFLVFIGGLSRLYGLSEASEINAGMVFALFMELALTPAIFIWHQRWAENAA